jgi:hypothetical protein
MEVREEEDFAKKDAKTKGSSFVTRFGGRGGSLPQPPNRHLVSSHGILKGNNTENFNFFNYHVLPFRRFCQLVALKGKDSRHFRLEELCGHRPSTFSTL